MNVDFWLNQTSTWGLIGLDVPVNGLQGNYPAQVVVKKRGL